MKQFHFPSEHVSEFQQRWQGEYENASSEIVEKGKDPKCTLRAFAPAQLAVRVDDHRKLLIYDCFAWKPKCRNLQSDEELPTNGELKAFEDSNPFNQSQQRSGFNDFFEDEYSEDEEDEEFNNTQVSREDGASFDSDVIHVLHFRAIGGEFFNSRMV